MYMLFYISMRRMPYTIIIHNLHIAGYYFFLPDVLQIMKIKLYF